jgi:predicted dehydrogenase
MSDALNHQTMNVAIIGMGGFAGDHHRAMHALEKQGECRLLCTCDPQPEAFQTQREEWEFAARGVAVYTDYRDMLETHGDALDMVTIPTPIPLHAPMHRAVIERGLGCYLEKPPTLDIAELDEMLAVEANAKKQTQVGFNFIIEAERQAMKRRILDGEFGAVKRIGFLGITPRATIYFNRSAWAGRLYLAGRLVLDSVMGNANSHYLHNLLFWAGQGDILSWASVAAVEAEMYRAAAIENFDTLFARGTCENGVEVLVATTHAHAGGHAFEEWIECEQATIRHSPYHQPYIISYNDGRQETIPTTDPDLLRENFRYYLRYLRGEEPRPLTSLSDTRPFVEYYDLAYVAAKQITHVGGQHVTQSQTADGKGTFTAIQGIWEACETFLATGRFPSQQGLPWARPGGRATRAELGQFHDVIAHIATTA